MRASPYLSHHIEFSHPITVYLGKGKRRRNRKIKRKGGRKENWRKGKERRRW
jgi:hypothetical protein